MSIQTHDRSYMQARVGEALASGSRYGRPFSLLVFEAVPSSDCFQFHLRAVINHALEALATGLRPSDVIARVFEDTVAVLLVETDANGARDALFRMRERLSRHGSIWNVAMYSFPAQRETIEGLPFLAAA